MRSLDQQQFDRAAPDDMSEFHHGHEPRAEGIARHQKYLTLESQIDAATVDE